MGVGEGSSGDGVRGPSERPLAPVGRSRRRVGRRIVRDDGSARSLTSSSCWRRETDTAVRASGSEGTVTRECVTCFSVGAGKTTHTVDLPVRAEHVSPFRLRWLHWFYSLL